VEAVGEKVRTKPFTTGGRVTIVDTGLVGRPDGEGEDDTLTLPENPLRLSNVILLCPELPWGTLRETGFAEMAKSARLIVAV